MTPEQVIGNVWRSVLFLKRAGIRVHNRPQAIGAAVIGSLTDNGYSVVETRYLRIIEQGNDDLDAENNRLREQLAARRAEGAQQ